MRKTILLLALCGIGATASAADRPDGYLPKHSVDLPAIVPPAPVAGDIRYETDRDVYRDMAPLIGSPRWELAKRDVDTSTPALLADFSCAFGLKLTPDAFTRTTHLLDRVSGDTLVSNNDAKEHWRRQRPYMIDDGETCQDKADLGKSFDYPSGHTTLGWAVGLVLAEIAPDRATPILARARAYGESRIVCRVHNLSAVEAGRLGATVTIMAVRATKAYQDDLAAARAEIAAARRHDAPAPDAARCAIESASTATSVLAGLK